MDNGLVLLTINVVEPHFVVLILIVVDDGLVQHKQTHNQAVKPQS